MYVFISVTYMLTGIKRKVTQLSFSQKENIDIVMLKPCVGSVLKQLQWLKYILFILWKQLNKGYNLKVIDTTDYRQQLINIREKFLNNLSSEICKYFPAGCTTDVLSNMAFLDLV